MYRLLGQREMTASAESSMALDEEKFPLEESSVEDFSLDRHHPYMHCISMTFLGIVLFGVILMYGVFPLAFYASSWLRRTLVFEAYRSREDLSDPARFGLNGSRNFYIDSTPKGIRIGAWYISSEENAQKDSLNFADDERPVVLLMHGIMANRGKSHRARLAQRLANEAGVHVVAIDYRGFGDSTFVMPSLDDEATDSLAAYDAIRKETPAERIVLWGHSMGTAVALKVAAELQRRNEMPAAIVLESAFDNIGSVTSYSTLAKFWYWVPGLGTVFTLALTTDPATAANNIQQAHLISPSVPILMLHSEDDSKTPLAMADTLRLQLVRCRMDTGVAGPVKSVIFEKKHKFGHNWMVNHPDLPVIVKEFLKKQTIGQSALDQIVL